MTQHDDFDDPKINNFLSSVGPKAAFFIVLIALSFMIGVVWKLYTGGGDSNNNPSDNVPIIRADKEPYKVQPDEPGGMKMPNKDSTIFSSLNSDDEDRGIENLLADNDEEDPMPRSQLFAGLNTERDESLHAEAQDMPLDKPLTEDEERIMSQAKEAQAIVSNLIDQGVDAIEATDNETETAAGSAQEEKPEPVKKTEVKPKSQEDSKPESKPAPVVAPKVETKAEVKKPEPKKTPPKPAPKTELEPKAQLTFNKPVTLGGDYYIQLASVQDRKRTEDEWNKLKKKYGSVLSGYKYRVETAQLAKGTYYRIQAGPVSKEQANKTCKAIKRQTPGGCIVKKK